MKKIRYEVLGYTSVFNPVTNEVETQECVATVIAPYSTENEETAKQVTYNGKCEVFDDQED